MTVWTARTEVWPTREGQCDLTAPCYLESPGVFQLGTAALQGLLTPEEQSCVTPHLIPGRPDHLGLCSCSPHHLGAGLPSVATQPCLTASCPYSRCPWRRGRLQTVDRSLTVPVTLLIRGDNGGAAGLLPTFSRLMQPQGPWGHRARLPGWVELSTSFQTLHESSMLFSNCLGPKIRPLHFHKRKDKSLYFDRIQIYPFQ